MKNKFLIITMTAITFSLVFAGGGGGAGDGGDRGDRGTTRECVRSVLDAGNRCVNNGLGEKCEKAVDKALDKCVGGKDK